MGAVPASQRPSPTMREHLNPRGPIAVFDSGVGGLTVVGALMERPPIECIHQFGHTGRVPNAIM